MSVVETVLVFVVIPVGSLALIALVTFMPYRGQTPRYRNGEGWDHPPVWWAGNPEGIRSGYPTSRSTSVQGRRAGAAEIGGGARGTW